MIFVTAILAALVILVLLYLLVFVRPKGKKPKNPKLLCDYAHRGLHGKDVPENSLLAFSLACQHGYGIELDVQLSSDGEVMVFHDYTLLRMTGRKGKLSDTAAKELQALSLGGTDQTIPTFSEVLSLVDGKVPLLVELKGESLNTSLCQKVAEQLLKYNGDYCIESFNPLLIKTIKRYLPHAYTGQLYTNVCRDKKKRSLLHLALTAMAFNFIARPDFIAYNKKDRHSLPVKLATRFYKAPKFVWTLKTEDEIALAHSLGELPIFEKTKKP